MVAGSAMDLRYADEHCAAVLQAWYPGARGGTAIADVPVSYTHLVCTPLLRHEASSLSM